MRLLYWGVFVLLATTGLVACGDSADDTTTTSTPAALITEDATIGCLTVTAFAAESASAKAAEVAPCDQVQGIAFKDGAVATTDDDGEAWVDIGPSCRIFLFRKTTLTKSTCAKGGTGSGACVSNGTAVVKGCSADVELGTPGATIDLTGTWATITYRPELTLTQVDVLEGSAEITAITDIDTGAEGPTETIEAGQSLYTVTDDFLADAVVLDLVGEVGSPVATVDLYTQAFEQELPFAAYSAVLGQAELDGVLSADLAAVAESAPWVLRVGSNLDGAEAGGIPGENDMALLEAVEVGVNWEEIVRATGISLVAVPMAAVVESPALTPGGRVDLTATSGLELTRLSDSAFDLRLAVELLPDAVIEEPDVIVLVSGESDRALDAANQMAESLGAVGLVASVESVFASDVEVLAAYNTLLAEGVRVIALTQR